MNDFDKQMKHANRVSKIPPDAAGDDKSICNDCNDDDHCNGTIKKCECYCRIVNQSTPPKIEEWEKFCKDVNVIITPLEDESSTGADLIMFKEQLFRLVDSLITQTCHSTIEEAKGCVPADVDSEEQYYKGFRACRSQMLENLNKLNK